MHRCPFIATAWIIVILLAVCIRFNSLADRPIHADEATGARILAQRLEDNAYSFDPVHFHGPLLTAIASPLARLRDETSWRELTEGTLRLTPALAGSLLVLVPLLFRRWIGQGGALAGALLLATSPLLVYYSRMFIHEMLLALTGLLALAALMELVRQPGKLSAVAAGLLMGLMWAAKETFIITLLAWGLALVPVVIIMARDAWAGKLKELVPCLGWLVAGILFSSMLLYSDFLRHPSGIIDSIRTYFVYETVAGHEKPGGYYIDLLLWPKWKAGVLWWEGTVALMALLAVAIQAGNNASSGRKGVIAFLGLATAVQFLIYSCIAYKTPWLMVVPWAHACLLGGCLLAEVSNWRSAFRYAGMGLLLVVSGLQVHQSLKATGRFANDTRNPYAYVPTTRDAVRLGNWLEELDQAVRPESIEPIAVVGKGYWPLPWYLRNFSSIGYWSQTGEFPADQPLAIVLPGNFEETDAYLGETHVALPRSLREDTPLMVYIRKDLWHKWMGAPAP